MDEPEKDGKINLEEIYTKLKGDNLSAQKIVLSYVKKQIDEEKDRQKNVESKSTTLLGFTGIMASFIITYGKFLYDLIDMFNNASFLIQIILYICTVFSLLITIISSLDALIVTKYDSWFHHENIYEFQTYEDIEIIKNWITTLVYSYMKKRDKINEQVTSLKKAQQYFAYTTFLFLTNSVLMSAWLLIVKLDP